MTLEPWHAFLVEGLEEAADLASQRAAWVERKEIQFPDPTELICQLFDDSGVDALLETGQIVFSEPTDAALRELSAIAGDLQVDEEPADLLASDAWLSFVHEAARVLLLVRRDLAT